LGPEVDKITWHNNKEETEHWEKILNVSGGKLLLGVSLRFIQDLVYMFRLSIRDIRNLMECVGQQLGED
jgi:hypothetical protein